MPHGNTLYVIERMPHAPVEPGRARNDADQLGRLGAFRPVLEFLLVFAFLDTVVNLRYPRGEIKFWYLTPSIDVVVVFALGAAFGIRHKRVPIALHGLVFAFFSLVRLVRFGDGVKFYHFQRPLNLYLDIGLVPSLVRLGYQTLPLAALLAVIVAIPLGLGGLGYLVHRALRSAEHGLGSARVRIAYFAIVAVMSLLSFNTPHAHDPRYFGAFAASAAPRLAEEAAFLLDVQHYRGNRFAAIERASEELRRSPVDLSGLAGQDVLVFFIESYGAVVVERPDFARRMLPAYAQWERTLSNAGVWVRSSALSSPTYGGNSWLAHTTFATGVRVGDELDLELIERQKPLTLAQVFRRARYRTVLVQPGTTRLSETHVTSSFDRHYYAWELGYRGPQFGWAEAPDQYTLDFIRRNLFNEPGEPLFLECMLVSSHAPWQVHAPLIADWDSIGDGSLYHELPELVKGSGWLDLQSTGDAYLDSILYDLELLARFAVEFVDDDALIVVLGDHQPTAAITRDSASWNVPIHVLSRRRAFVDAFAGDGFTPGFAPGSAPLPMEAFAHRLVQRFADRAPDPE